MRADSGARRGLVPAARSLRLAAAWTGAAAAIVSAVMAIAAVAVLWLPAADGAGSGSSAVRAGVLTYLAALHGGITVDALPATFVPLGMTILVGVVAWRAGTGLAGAARELGEADVWRLTQAAVLQAGVFAAVSGVAAGYATLGTSRVSPLAAGLAGFALFAVSGGVAFCRSSPLGDAVRGLAPDWVGPALRAAGAGIAVYLGAGALLVMGSLVVHHQRVETLSRELGSGWSGVPVLLLGVLAAPNAAIAGASYLSGAGFAVGSGSEVAWGSTVHATLPAFPLLGAVPSGPATEPVWLLVAVTPLVAALCAARAASTDAAWQVRLRNGGAGAVLAAGLGAILAWEGGGAIGSGRLSVFGASAWQFGLAVGLALGLVSVACLGVRQALAWWGSAAAERNRARAATLAAVLSMDDADDADGDGDSDGDEELAG